MAEVSALLAPDRVNVLLVVAVNVAFVNVTAPEADHAPVPVVIVIVPALPPLVMLKSVMLTVGLLLVVRPRVWLTVHWLFTERLPVMVEFPVMVTVSLLAALLL